MSLYFSIWFSNWKSSISFVSLLFAINITLYGVCISPSDNVRFNSKQDVVAGRLHVPCSLDYRSIGYLAITIWRMPSKCVWHTVGQGLYTLWWVSVHLVVRICNKVKINIPSYTGVLDGSWLLYFHNLNIFLECKTSFISWTAGVVHTHVPQEQV